MKTGSRSGMKWPDSGRLDSALRNHRGGSEAERSLRGGHRRSAAVMERKFRAGTRVRHPSWGEGIVLDSKVQDDDEFVDVIFESVGVKKVSANLAKLKVL